MQFEQHRRYNLYGHTLGIYRGVAKTARQNTDTCNSAAPSSSTQTDISESFSRTAGQGERRPQANLPNPSTYPKRHTDNDLIYTLEYNPKINYNRSIWKPVNSLQEKILWYFKNDRVYYQDNNVGNAISNYLKESRG